MSDKPISKWVAIFKHKCPRCHEGNLYTFKNPYTNLTKISDMPTNCPVCNQNYTPETGFYFGAAYVSYALTVAFGVALLVASFVFGVREFKTFMWIIGIGLVILAPLTLRLSRTMWIHIFIKYKGR